MHIHDYEKLWLGVAVLLIVGFIGTVTYGAVGVGVTMVDESGPTVNSTLIGQGNYGAVEGFQKPGVNQTGPDEYTVHVVAGRFFYQPNPIVVPANSTVTFRVTSADVIHGFDVVGTNANTMVIPGEVSEITVEVNEPTEYGIICHEYCGSGHHTMQALLRVVPESQYKGGTQ